MRYGGLMKDLHFTSESRLPAKALFLAERLDVRSFRPDERIATNPAVVEIGGGHVVLFRYGAVVLFGLSPEEESFFLDELAPYLLKPFEKLEEEKAFLAVDPVKVEGVDGERIVLHNFTVERLQLVAAVLARSVVLDYYETSVAESFARVEPLAENLRRKGRPGSEGKELLRHLGDTLAIHGRMVGRIEITEKPDLLWNYPEHERFFRRLEDEYDLRERHLALERKLDLISKTAETLIDLLQNRRSLRVEWYITILIVFEILLSLYEMFVRNG